MGTVLALATFVIDNLPLWIDSGMKVWELYQKTRAVIDSHKGPGEDDWNALDARAIVLEERINDTSKDV